MNALLIYPIFPPTFWSFEGILRLVGRRALLPPLGLVTVAALLPQDWTFRLIDRNVTTLTEDDWAWADVVFLSGMIVQRADFIQLIGDARARDKAVVVGGPYVTSVPEESDAAGADYLVLDEGEITIPQFLADIRDNGIRRRNPGDAAIYFRAGGERPDVTSTPIPRFDLLDLQAYDGMAVQYSRGCPFLCEFCDIITLYGRKPRTKTSEQIIGELEYLMSIGRRGPIFLVDDNFIGNKKNVKKLLLDLREWQHRNDFPFSFDTEASIDLAADPELIRLMVDCRFSSVFIGIETPDTESLALTRKHQNNRHPMVESVQTITRAGLRIMCGMIIGFDNETPGAGQRIVNFIEAASIPTVLFSMLQALPNTALWTRLTAEGRLMHNNADMDNTTVLNFRPTRPAAQIMQEYVEAYSAIYAPKAYLNRVYRHFLELGTAPLAAVPRIPSQSAVPAPARVQPPLPAGNQQSKPASEPSTATPQPWLMAKAVFTVLFRQGFQRETRFLFWRYFFTMAVRRPSVFGYYLIVCAHYEHFVLYRERIRQQFLPALAKAPSYNPASEQILARNEPDREVRAQL